MPLFSRWWTFVAASLCYVGLLVSGERDKRQDGAQPELFIFNELCALKDNPGPCKAMKDRYFFSVDTGRCELFEYGGCRGNRNNFETLEECEETCVVSDGKDPCHLPEAPGPCRGLLKRYLFDSKDQQCRTFFYGGCFGNANNFKTMAECQAKCQNPVKPTDGPVVVTKIANTPSALPSTGTGELTSLTRPLVVLNGSSEPEEVKPRDKVCLQPVDTGTCDGAEKRFAFHSKTRRCQSFVFSGCGGNENNFTTRRHCIKKCMKSRKHNERMIRIRRKNMDIIHRPSSARNSTNV
ncbi:tissue factor pathway inhibitor a isoform X2 [Cynoglossus semilaevis]|uniref:tissue factor pathway inhibitor a isoform X2 n=1 Tax=Cynoglossus semilaevis TaxID=244447 RepID=UPI000495352D|nr:tissue factor pathway inhibitor-like isoform X2 [Cynoglossus semilaevis]